MGCGQSKIGSLYSRSKAKHKKALHPPPNSTTEMEYCRAKKRFYGIRPLIEDDPYHPFTIRAYFTLALIIVDPDDLESYLNAGGAGGGEDDGGADVDGEGGCSTPASPSAAAEAEARRKALANRVRQVLSSGPLLAQAEVSSSQLDFFRMLDERIENGPDYVSGSDDDVLSVPERQSSLPEDEQHGCCRLETKSLTLSQEEAAQETPTSAAGRRAVALAASAPAQGDAIKSPVMNGELRRWDGPQAVADGRQGNGIERGGNPGTPRGKTTPKSNT